jgi:hypothetical protein
MVPKSNTVTSSTGGAAGVLITKDIDKYQTSKNELMPAMIPPKQPITIVQAPNIGNINNYNNFNINQIFVNE